MSLILAAMMTYDCQTSGKWVVLVDWVNLIVLSETNEKHMCIISIYHRLFVFLGNGLVLTGVVTIGAARVPV